MTNEQKEVTGKWLINLVLMLFISVLAWNFIRECERTDRHETRITSIERTIVSIEFMARDIGEIKKNVEQLRDR